MISKHSANPYPTQFPELNELLAEFTAEVRGILGDDFVGAYLQGSFALGDADLASDCDFLVVVRSLSDEREAALRRLHDQIPTRDGFWCCHPEGAYA